MIQRYFQLALALTTTAAPCVAHPTKMHNLSNAWLLKILIKYQPGRTLIIFKSNYLLFKAAHGTGIDTRIDFPSP